MEVNQSFLEHYGILGMKWGRRKGKTTGKSASAKAGADPDYIKAKQLKKKRLKDMSNAELEYLTKRLNLEKNYKALTSGKESPGKKIAKKILEDVGKQSLREASKKILENEQVKQTMASIAKKAVAIVVRVAR